MLKVTKIFRFETAHAIHGYSGACRFVHGHSYVLHVTVSLVDHQEAYLPKPGFVIDFKDLKNIVNEAVVDKLDHRLILSKDYLKEHPLDLKLENLCIWDMEPTAENILLYILNKLKPLMPEHVQLENLRLYETADSYADWSR